MPPRKTLANTQLSTIQHIVTLMLENRSFDNILGFLYTDQGNKSPTGQPFEGLTGTESNPLSPGKNITVYKIQATDENAYYMPGSDPGEGYAATNSQLFGNTKAPTPPVATNQGFVSDYVYTLGWESKKTGWILPGTVPQNVMGVFTPEMLPILSSLARGYAVCDQWYSSAPTETMPNRAFANAATSQGHMNDDTKSFTVPSIFGLMSDHNVNWSIFGYDEEPLTRQDFPDTLAAADSHFGVFKDFQAAAANGTLPAYTFLEPDWSATGNSEHPNYDVALGEQLIHDVYYALRNGKGWNQTLLIITYDEHGGCYDHVPPPMGAVPPDNCEGEYGFDFKRFGVRVPAVLVSPLIAAGTVFRVPANSMPLDHTSILKTVEKRWGLPNLTARDAAAPDIGAVLTLDTPRTDDPLQGVTVPVSTTTKSAAKAVAAAPPSHLQQVHAQLVAQLPVKDEHGAVRHELPELKTSADYKAFIHSRTEAWKASKKSNTQTTATIKAKTKTKTKTKPQKQPRRK